MAGKAMFRVTLYRRSKGLYAAIIRDFEDGITVSAEAENPMEAFALADTALERKGGGLGKIIMNGDPADWLDD